MFSSVLDEVHLDYKDKIDMYKVNVEKERDMAMMFNARALPYIVFISKDGAVTTQAGALDKNTLQYYFDGLLSK